MTATVAEARDQMLTLFRNAWIADADSVNVPVIYDDTKVDLTTNDSFARVTIKHNLSRQASLTDSTMTKRYRRSGLLFVQVFTPLGDGMKKNDDLVAIAMNAFEGKTTAGGVIFRSVSNKEVGETDRWFQTNVVAEFEYDEVK